jgi:ubiquinone/menaquinone biosynthesis C-methylase UbiE
MVIMQKIRKALAYPPSLVNYLQEKIMFTYTNPLWDLVTRIRGMGTIPDIKVEKSNRFGVIDEFWASNTVYAPLFRSAFQSRMNLQWRFRTHPMFKELTTGLYGSHDGEVILDYGCGPGNDLVGFSIYSRAKKIIGMDISYTAMSLAAHRLALHKIDPGRIKLIQINDTKPSINLPSESVDFISCQGVLMHTSHPDRILAEFLRILKPGSLACVMVYSRPSIWYHLYTAYEQMIVKDAFPGLDIEEAFSKNTDGVDCPMARCYPVNDFITMCELAGFECQFVGGYLTEAEIISLRIYLGAALKDPRLEENHKKFLLALTFDEKKLPKYQGYYAGVSGVYYLKK